MVVRRMVIILLIAVFMAACSDDGDSATPALPTLDSQQSDGQVAETEAAGTPVPSDTPRPTVPVRATLPPTFTPEPSITPIPPTPTNTEGPPPTTVRTFQVCDGFGVDFSAYQEEFIMGESPLLAWTPLEGARSYRVYIRNFTGREVHQVIVTDAFVAVNPDVFELAGRYSWEVQPLDEQGIQICPGGGESLRAIEPN